jgi:hypothetical protein
LTCAALAWVGSYQTSDVPKDGKLGGASLVMWAERQDHVVMITVASTG